MAYTKTVWVDGSDPFTPASPGDPKINAANLNKIENELEYLDGALSPTIRNAIVDLFQKCAYIDTDPSIASNIAILETWADALNSITAVYTQSGSVYNTDSLDTLKADLVVTAIFSDSSTAIVPSADYTLSGDLEVGTSTITVIYRGKTATFTVTVTNIIDSPLPTGYTAYDYVYNNYGKNYLNTQLGKEYVDTSYEMGVKFSVPNLTQNTGSSAIYCLRQNTTGATSSRAVWVKGVSNANNLAVHLANSDSGFIYKISGATAYEVVTVDKKAYLDGNLIYTATGAESTPTQGYITFWGRYDGGSFHFGLSVYRIYKFWVKDPNGAYVAYMVPCTNGNGEAGFYDKVRKSFYAGTADGNNPLHAGND